MHFQTINKRHMNFFIEVKKAMDIFNISFILKCYFSLDSFNLHIIMYILFQEDCFADLDK